jgi:hypothetical protein
MDFSPTGWMCSFCGVQGAKETRFGGGLGAMICMDCLGYYYETFLSPKKTKKITRPVWDEMSDTEMLAKLALIVDSVNQGDKFLRSWIDLLRERKLSWAQIGQAVGISRQAAWERFSQQPAKRQGQGSA